MTCSYERLVINFLATLQQTYSDKIIHLTEKMVEFSFWEICNQHKMCKMCSTVMKQVSAPNSSASLNTKLIYIFLHCSKMLVVWQQLRRSFFRDLSFLNLYGAESC